MANKFQSTPAITGGRAPLRPRRALDLDHVSIHARHYWRARHPMSACALRMRLRFNPRPPLLAGEPRSATLGTACPASVSIHARHYWRASLCDHRPTAPRRTSYNPPPPLLAGEPRQRPRLNPQPKGFNPRPPLLAGEPGFTLIAALFLCCFNPRPPLLAGEPDKTARFDAKKRVSIHARHYWRASQRHATARNS